MNERQHTAIGYMLVVQPRDDVFVGGLLVTTDRGRPLEFQCTAPVAPNATQKMLYGRTLTPHVCGDVIGAALLKKATTRPSLILLGDALALDVREHARCPVAVLEDDGRGAAVNALNLSSAEESPPTREMPPEASVDESTGFPLGDMRLRVHEAYREDIGQIRALGLDVEADLSEPLERVREALGQTLRSDAA